MTIGRGGFGEVLLCQHAVTRQMCAVKAMRLCDDQGSAVLANLVDAQLMGMVSHPQHHWTAGRHQDVDAHIHCDGPCPQWITGVASWRQPGNGARRLLPGDAAARLSAALPACCESCLCRTRIRASGRLSSSSPTACQSVLPYIAVVACRRQLSRSLARGNAILAIHGA
ncbi:hypothetical protein BC831DRAFT_455558 [Entophlyctis helioformis]|nr:hypothetical protein BC831DRAFT_455558 [Entophlyctis helioformis]